MEVRHGFLNENAFVPPRSVSQDANVPPEKHCRFAKAVNFRPAAHISDL